MERAQQQRWRKVSGVHVVHQTRKQKSFGGLSLGSCFNPDGNPTDEKISTLLSQELERRYSGRLIGTLPTKLHAEHFDEESKGFSQTAISRLKNLEGLPSFLNVSGRRKRLSGNDTRRNVSISNRSNGEIYDGEWQSRSSSSPHDSLYVWEDMDESRYIEGRVSSRWSPSSMRSKIEPSITQKHVEGRHSFDDETWSPKPLLDSHFRDIKVDPVSTLRSHRTVSRSLDFGGEKSNGYSPPPIRKDRLLLEPGYFPAADFHLGSGTKQLENTNDADALLTRSIVFKPNHGRDYPCVGGGAEEILYRRNDSFCNDPSRNSVPSEVREIARATTRRMSGARDEVDARKFSCFMRYSKCENSCSDCCGEFKGEMEMRKIPLRCYNRRCSSSTSLKADGIESGKFKLPSKGNNRFRYPPSLSSNSRSVDFRFKSFKWPLRGNKWSRCPSSGLVKRSSSMMDKKSVLERWKLTDTFQELEILDQGRTPDEMIVISDGESKFKHLNSLPTYDIVGGNQFGGCYGNDLSVSLGMSSTGRWKVKNHRPSSGSRSRLLLGSKSRRKGAYHCTPARSISVTTADESNPCERNSTLARSKMIPKYKLPSPYTSREKVYLPSENQRINAEGNSSALFELKMEANVKDFFKQKCMIQIPTRDIAVGNLVTGVMMADLGCNAMSSEFSKLNPMQSSDIDNDALIGDQEDSCNQELAKGLTPLQSHMTSSETIKETKNTFIFSKQNKASGSENVGCGEINDLQEKPKHHRHQYPNVSCVFPSNEQVLSLLSKDLSLKYEGWEYSYALKVLAQSGLEKFPPNFLCPLNPSLFDNIEKKYGDEMMRLRSERMFIFDNINSAILEAFRQHVDVYPWLKPTTANGSGGLGQLILQEYAGNGLLPERLRFNPEIVWGDSKREMDGIGNEIEMVMTDELVNELVFEWKKSCTLRC